MYNLDPHGTVMYNGVEVPVILCHYDSHKLGLGSNHGDVYHWFNKYGKTMDDVRDDVAALMKKTGGSSSSGTESATYNVGDIVDFAGGTSYVSSDAVSGSTAKATKAKITAKADKAKHPYHVRAVNDNGGYTTGVWGWVDANTISAAKKDAVVEDKKDTEAEIKVGDVIKLVDGATYASGATIPSWVFGKTLYARELQGDNVVFSTLKTGAITGVVNKKHIVGHEEEFKPYIVRVTVDVLNIRAGAGSNYALKGTITDRGAYTIVEEKNGYGRLKSGAGWIYLDYTKKV